MGTSSLGGERTKLVYLMAWPKGWEDGGAPMRDANTPPTRFRHTGINSTSHSTKDQATEGKSPAKGCQAEATEHCLWTYKTIGEALDALYALLYKASSRKDAVVEAAFKEVRRQAQLSEKRVLELEKRVEELKAKVEEAAVERKEAALERKDIMTTLLKVLDYLKIIESPSTSDRPGHEASRDRKSLETFGYRAPTNTIIIILDFLANYQSSSFSTSTSISSSIPSSTKPRSESSGV
ncbi:hypothetical protein BGX38DRAFT_456862 [Terfezia claveryi]|nr:hypothetical protein BGX38DRAFT_456862 [Terfezia claveryi]